MTANLFPPLSSLSFVRALDGSEAFAEYGDNEANTRHTVERRPAGDTPALLEEFHAISLAPHIASVTAVHEVGDAFFLVYAETFAAVLPAKVQDRSWSAKDRSLFLHDVMTAIRALHTTGLLHGDLTPDTILVTTTGRAVLAAIARRPNRIRASLSSVSGARTFGPTLTRSRATGGALSYLAPEQFMGASPCAESDIFAWGVIAFEVATGRNPFGFITDPTVLLQAVGRGPAAHVHELAPHFSEAFNGALRLTLFADQKRRVFPADPPSSWTIAEAAPEAAQTPIDAAPHAPSKLVPAVVLLVALGGLAYFVMSR